MVERPLHSSVGDEWEGKILVTEEQVGSSCSYVGWRQ